MQIILSDQKNGYILLTGNRSTKDGNKSLELTIRHLVTPDSLPVLTVYGKTSKVY